MAALTAADIADIQSPGSVRISPDGKWVVYVLRICSRAKKNQTTTLWVAEIGKEFSARQITSGNYHDDSPRFSPDGSCIIFLSDRDTPGKLSTIYQLPVDQAGEALALTPAENEKSINSFEWSPDGKYIAYLSADEATKEQRVKDEAGDDAKVYGQDVEYARLRLFDISERTTRVLINEDAHVANLSWAPDSKAIAYTLCKSPEIDLVRINGDIYVTPILGEEKFKVCHFEAGIIALVWGDADLLWISPQDGRSIFTSFALWSSKPTSNSIPSKVAYGDTDCAVDLQRCGSKAVVRIERGLSDHLEDANNQTKIAAWERNIIEGWDVHFNGRRMLTAYVQSSLLGGDVMSRIGDEVVQLSKHEKVEFDYHIETVEFASEDGFPIDGVLYRPADQPVGDGPAPTVVIPHGGPYGRSAIGPDACWRWTPWLLAQGYTVLHPNYRGGSGHGAKYAEVVNGDTASSYQDVITLVKKCIADGQIDASRTAIAGWSQGGFLAYLAVTRSDNFHFAAAIAGAGVSDWDTMSMTSDIPLIESALAGRSPWLTPIHDVRARESSPLWHMDNISTPLLIVHGEQDVRVPVSQARSFHQGMMARGKSCEMAIYPREGHGSFPNVFERAHQIHMLETLKRFLAEYLKQSTSDS